jgi:DUF4097 and DUF4098 domain-containing protein YvlB
LLSLLPIQVGCDFETFADSSDRHREDFQYSYDLKPGGRLSLETFNGSVEILSWEKDSVQITGTKYAGRLEDLQDLKIEIQADPASVRIRAIRPAPRRGNMGAKFFIRVPRRVELENIVSSNGQIRLEDVEGNARLETSNGAVRIRRINGRLDVRTSNGTIEADDITSEAVMRTSNGAIRLDRFRGGLEASTSNGGITARLSDPEPQRALRFNTSNGSIDLTVEKLEGNEIRATTSNSSITVRLPDSVKAQLRAATSNSSIQTEIDVVSRSAGKSHLEGDINGGGPLIHLTTSNGSIRLLKL